MLFSLGFLTTTRVANRYICIRSYSAHLLSSRKPQETFDFLPMVLRFVSTSLVTLQGLMLALQHFWNMHYVTILSSFQQFHVMF